MRMGELAARTAAATAEVSLAPDSAAMLAHLRLLYGDPPQDLRGGLIEVSWTDRETGKLSHSRLYDLDELEKAAGDAARLNAVAGQSVYVGAALRKPKTPRWRRAADSDFFASTCAYADFDGPGDVERAEALCRERGVEPSFKVYTGRHPHPRAQFWFRLREPLLDPAACRRLNRAIADTLDGDTSVTNPSRVMRLGGSIAWPRKPGRIVERTELVLPEGGA